MKLYWYGCKSWTVKKAGCRRIGAFELWCWRPLRVPWTARRSNQSIPKEISPEYSLKDWCWSWNFNTSATWCEELTHWKRPWFWKRLKAGGEGDDRGWVVGWHHWLNGHEFERALGLLMTGKPGVLQSMGPQRVKHDWANGLKWTEIILN